jgi:hypothetical protein
LPGTKPAGSTPVELTAIGRVGEPVAAVRVGDVVRRVKLLPAKIESYQDSRPVDPAWRAKG